MNIFKIIQLRKPASACLHCAYFQNDPAFVEDAYPGLTAMSSGFASVRDKDGFCSCHQVYLSAQDSCPHFAHSVAGFNQADIERIDRGR